MIIYKVVNKINGMGYVGKTNGTLERRIKNHFYENKNNYFGNALKKYGIENFEWSILCECFSQESANEKEKFYIKEHNTKKPFGYNLTEGGEGSLGFSPSKETRRKQSKIKRGKYKGENHPNYKHGKYCKKTL